MDKIREMKRMLIDHFPSLIREWDDERNNKSIEKISCGSGYKAWWVCSECGHNWNSAVYSRTAGTGCPACSGKVSTNQNSLSTLFPNIAAEWGERNNCNPRDFTKSSGIKVWWECSTCKYEWKAAIATRTKGHGCPRCSGRKPGPEKLLINVSPNLAIEWSEENCMSVNSVSVGSQYNAQWVCEKCNYRWRTTVYHRSIGGTGCPRCVGSVVNDSNSLFQRCPELIREYDNTKNGRDVGTLTHKASYKAWWICQDCGYNWQAPVYRRTNGSGCPRCVGNYVSSSSQKWLDALKIKKSSREIILRGKHIPKWVRVDALEGGVVYEFLGDYWHGNPKVYEHKALHAHRQISFGAIYNETIHRLKSIRNSGFNLFCVWENDYKNGALQSNIEI